MLKEACLRGKWSDMSQQQKDKFKEIDNMQMRLNKNIQENIFPYWRNHQSLKGKYSNLRLQAGVA